MEKMLRHGEVGLVQMEANAVIVDLLNVLVAAPVGQETEHGGAHILGQPLLHGEHDVISRQFIPIVELNALPDVKVPGLQVSARLPFFQKAGIGDIVRLSFGQVITDQPCDIGSLHPREPGWVVNPLKFHGTLPDSSPFGLVSDCHTGFHELVEAHCGSDGHA